jgi:hypothetical protein
MAEGAASEAVWADSATVGTADMILMEPERLAGESWMLPGWTWMRDIPEFPVLPVVGEPLSETGELRLALAPA